MQQAVNEAGSCQGCPVRRESQLKLSKLPHVVVTTDLLSRLELQLRWSYSFGGVNPVAGTELRCGHGSTLYPWGPLGQWQTLEGVPQFLRWGHGDLLSEFSLAFSALGLETSLQRGAVHKSRGLPWLVRLSNQFQQRL